MINYMQLVTLNVAGGLTMIERYTLPEMKAIWSEENKFRKWLDVEIYACEALSELGQVPPAALAEIKEKANFNVARIAEIEAVTNHDIIAFTTNVAEYVGEAARYIHLGLTSSDVLDTALASLMKEAGNHLLVRLEKLKEALLEKAREHRNTVMIGRTHGIHAEPITFGLKMLLWTAETERCIERMQRAVETVSVGKISGAVGTYANINPRVEAHVCSRLGLKPAEVSTQILQRDRHAGDTQRASGGFGMTFRPLGGLRPPPRPGDSTSSFERAGKAPRRRQGRGIGGGLTTL
jgi:adenylosuccinate lyase